MNVIASLLAVVQRVEEQCPPAQSPLPACLPEALIELDRQVQSQFGEVLPDGYKKLLAATDGLIVEDIEVYGSARRRATFVDVDVDPDWEDPCVYVSSILQENNALRRNCQSFNDYLIFGETESDFLALDRRSRRFIRMDRISNDPMHEVGSFEELLWWTLATRLELPGKTFPAHS